jgi:Calcineurin-like phosphoesterase
VKSSPTGRVALAISLLMVGSMTAASAAHNDTWTGQEPADAGAAASNAVSVASHPSRRSRGNRRFPVLVAAGDISLPELSHQRATAKLVERLNPDQILLLGDNQYQTGSLRAYNRFYDPTWGRFKDITWPVPGNHEYYTRGAAGYFRYFGASARPEGTSYYSKDIGTWHVVALDSNIARGRKSAQLRWLRRDLAASDQPCTLAYWHHPRFSSGVEHGNDPSVRRFWKVLYRQRADIVLNGHEHNYERFARQTPSRRAARSGLREFVVGTGGAELYRLGRPDPNSQQRVTGRYGVLRLKLRDRSYSWKFVTARGRVMDRGKRAECH